jgi:hypothetical protein
MSENETLPVDGLYAEATEVVKLHTALLASSFKLISILGDIESEARFRKHSQSMNFSAGS